MAVPRVKNSKVRLVTSDREDEELQTGGVPCSFCRFTSDHGMPATSRCALDMHIMTLCRSMASHKSMHA